MSVSYTHLDVYKRQHVRCLIDECANIGQIPQLEKLVATIRSREISACLVVQTRSQLKAIYKDNADVYKRQLVKHGYKLKFFNTINFSKSMR